MPNAQALCYFSLSALNCFGLGTDIHFSIASAWIHLIEYGGDESFAVASTWFVNSKSF